MARTPSAAIINLICLLLLTVLITVLIRPFIDLSIGPSKYSLIKITSGKKSTQIKKVVKAEFDAILIKCPIDNGFILSGFIPGKSDIYASVSYDILFKAFLVNMAILNASCFVSNEVISIASQRHVKLYSITKVLPESDFVYWTDIDVVHNSLDFLKRAQTNHRRNCSIVASIEGSKFVDRHFKKLYPRGTKYMSGNIIVFRNSNAMRFIDIWYEKTLQYMHELPPDEAVLDDQWAFEYLTQIYKNSVCADNFMGYEGDVEAFHLVGPKKTEKLKEFYSSNHTLSLTAVIERFRSHIDSEKCTQYFQSKIRDIHFISKTAPEQWKMFDYNLYDDDEVKKIYDLCIGMQPFARTIQMINFVRYVVVYKSGGWYFDVDTSPTPETTKLFDFSVKKKIVVGIEEVFNSKVNMVICQWAFYFSRSNSFLKKMMSDILFDYFYYNKVNLPTTWITGSIRFSSILKHHNGVALILPPKSLSNKYITYHLNASRSSEEDREDWIL